MLKAISAIIAILIVSWYIKMRRLKEELYYG